MATAKQFYILVNQRRISSGPVDSVKEALFLVINRFTDDQLTAIHSTSGLTITVSEEGKIER